MPINSLELVTTAATAADDRKATDIAVIDLTKASDVCDYFVIATVSSKPQMDAVLEHVEECVASSYGERPLAIEGRAGARWVLIDYGAVVVHVFMPEAREYYRLERLWGEAPRVLLGLEGEMAELAWGDDAYAEVIDAATIEGAEVR